MANFELAMDSSLDIAPVIRALDLLIHKDVYFHGKSAPALTFAMHAILHGELRNFDLIGVTFNG